ncbi:helix-turn-helix transcriptional regulator [Actinacidiphila sp. ITFR-21]|uniref:helix-turn-helix transcriptional regulator n=1 Tax=Actinacidiphila sp. ITFR-21 TaxID=3075199 RepID=UPI00288BEC94|nr:helix-turn-helix transcriptional regulator [Streptomyces sp. ITFR-21]WNI17078.1 helix-turn-helix transcriptional regulator [Streptomyces sp. ITFR-21]
MRDDDETPALAIYQVLRARGTAASAGELGKAAGLDQDQAERGRRRLERLGLIRAQDGVLEPVDPDTALTRTMETYHATAAEQARSAVAVRELTDSLLTVYRPAVAREASLVEVEYYSDRRQKDRLLRELDSTVRHTSAAVHPGPVAPMEALDASARQDAEMIGRGVRNRTILPQSAAQLPHFNRHLRELAELGVEVRLIDHAPYDLIIYDSQVAVFLTGYQPRAESPLMVVVRGSALIQAQISVYEDLWLRAVPYEPAAPAAAPGDTELTPQERIAVRLLAEGLSDDQIARRMGVSRRTVQRAVTKLMERLGATSRFEAGIKLAQDPEFVRVMRRK